MRFKWDFQELHEFADRLSNEDKFNELGKIFVDKLARELREMLFNNTPVKTGQLAAGWGGGENYSYEIKNLKTGFQVTLYNRVPYAKAVNDGHYSHNQYNKGGRPYVVKHRTDKMHTVKGAIKDDTYVFGHFFVESTVLLMEDNNKINALLGKEFERWFRWCVNGK